MTACLPTALWGRFGAATLAASASTELFPRIAAVAVALATGLLAVACLRRLVRKAAPSADRRPPTTLLRRTVAVGVLASAGVLGATSLWPAWQTGHMHGWWLFGHMAGAGALVASGCAAAALAISDSVRPPAGRWSAGNGAQESCASRRRKRDAFPVAAIFLCAAVVAGSVLLSMQAFTGAANMQLLIEVHRYSGLGLLVMLLVNLSGSMAPLNKPRTRESILPSGPSPTQTTDASQNDR